MRSSTVLLLAAGAVAQNAATVEQNIAQTSTDILATNRTFADYESFTTVDVNIALNTYNNASLISTDLTNTITALQASRVFNSEDSEDIFVALTGLLPPVFDLLDNLVRYCNAYTNLGVQSLVLGQLQSQSDLTNQELAAARAKVVAPYTGLLDFGSGLIRSRFDTALSIYSIANVQSVCPPPGSTAYPSSTVTVTAPGATVTRTSTLTRTVTNGSGPGKTSTITKTSTKTVTTGAPGGTVTKTATKTVTTGAPGKTVTKTVTSGAPGGTVTKTATKTVTTGGPGKTITKTATITKGPTVTLPGKTVTTHCTITLTKTKTITAPAYCPPSY